MSLRTLLYKCIEDVSQLCLIYSIFHEYTWTSSKLYSFDGAVLLKKLYSSYNTVTEWVQLNRINVSVCRISWSFLVTVFWPFATLIWLKLTKSNHRFDSIKQDFFLFRCSLIFGYLMINHHTLKTKTKSGDELVFTHQHLHHAQSPVLMICPKRDLIWSVYDDNPDVDYKTNTHRPNSPLYIYIDICISLFVLTVCI